MQNFEYIVIIYRCLEYLLRNDANPGIRDKQGYNAVHYSAAYGHRLCLQLVRFLNSCGRTSVSFYSNNVMKMRINESRNKFCCFLTFLDSMYLLNSYLPYKSSLIPFSLSKRKEKGENQISRGGSLCPSLILPHVYVAFTSLPL